jgi:ABC-type lipoprotein release transport system permease subunit
MLGYGIIALQMLGVMKKQNVRALNLHKPRILTQKSNDIFKCGSSIDESFIILTHCQISRFFRYFCEMQLTVTKICHFPCNLGHVNVATVCNLMR